MLTVHRRLPGLTALLIPDCREGHENWAKACGIDEDPVLTPDAIEKPAEGGADREGKKWKRAVSHWTGSDFTEPTQSVVGRFDKFLYRVCRGKLRVSSSPAVS